MDNTELMPKSAIEIIAEDINNIKKEAARQLLSASCKIGMRLIQAKSLVPFGEWGEWLKNNVDYSESTAQNLMRIYREYGDEQVGIDGKSPSEIFGALSYSQALELFALPPAERQEFVEENDVANMSTRDLKEAIAEKKAAQKIAREVGETAERLKEENKAAKARIEELENELISAEDSGREESEEEIRQLKAKLEKTVEESSSTFAALEKARQQLEKEKKKKEELRQQVKQLTEAPAEVSPEQLEKLQEEIAEKFREETEQLKLNAEAEKASRERMEAELQAAKKKLQMSSEGDLHKFQALFERFQTDLEKLVALARSIGGEKEEKLIGALKGLVESI